MNHWEDPTIPKHGWLCDFVDDLKDSCDFENYADCWMCGHEQIRYVHHLRHSKYPDVIEVGCVCAGKLTGDVQAAKDREHKLRNRAARRSKWLTRNWKISAKGNPRLKVGGMYVTVYQRGNLYTYSIEGEFASNNYPTEDAAKLAAFDRWWQKQEEFISSPYCRKGYDDPVHARWGAFFADLRWKPEYKPAAVSGWQPTFRIVGEDGYCYVKVELQYQLGTSYFDWLQETLGTNYEGENLLIVGLNPYYSPEYGHPMIGWTNESYCDGNSFDEAPFITDDQGSFDFCHSTGSYRGRLTGYYEGGHWPLANNPLSQWTESINKLR